MQLKIIIGVALSYNTPLSQQISTIYPISISLLISSADVNCSWASPESFLWIRINSKLHCTYWQAKSSQAAGPTAVMDGRSSTIVDTMPLFRGNPLHGSRVSN